MRCNAGGGKQVASTPAAAEQAVAGVSTPRDTLSIPQGHPFALSTPEGQHLWWPTTPELESLLPQMTPPPSPRVMGTGSALQAVEGMNTTQQLLQSAASTASTNNAQQLSEGVVDAPQASGPDDRSIAAAARDKERLQEQKAEMAANLATAATALCLSDGASACDIPPAGQAKTYVGASPTAAASGVGWTTPSIGWATPPPSPTVSEYMRLLAGDSFDVVASSPAGGDVKTALVAFGSPVAAESSPATATPWNTAVASSTFGSSCAEESSAATPVAPRAFVSPVYSYLGPTSNDGSSLHSCSSNGLPAACAGWSPAPLSGTALSCGPVGTKE